jgi:hypothetical protein
MADSALAINPYEEKACEACGSPFSRGTLADLAFACKRLCTRKCGAWTVAPDDPKRLHIRFMNKVDRRPGHGPNGDCWLWIGRKDKKGYGVTKVGNIPVKAHRVALFGHDGLNDPKFACHRCDNPLCVRPDHLFAGDAIDNVRDMIAKGRANMGGGGQPGPRVPSGKTARKLTPDQVREIRRTGITGQAGCAKYGVSEFTIRAIRRGDLYKGITL